MICYLHRSCPFVVVGQTLTPSIHAGNPRRGESISRSSYQTWFGSGFERIEFARDGHDAENTISILVKDVESALDALEPGDRTDLPEAVIAALRALQPRRKPGA